jgi:hypothetical protein
MADGVALASILAEPFMQRALVGGLPYDEFGRRGNGVSRLLVRTRRELATHGPGAAMMKTWLLNLLQLWTSCAGWCRRCRASQRLMAP